MEYTDNQYAREASQIEKTSMNKSKSFTKTFSQLFLFLLFFHLLFSSYVHAPCAHYRERKRQVCIILNEFFVVDVVHLASAALLKQDFSLSYFRHLFPIFFPLCIDSCTWCSS